MSLQEETSVLYIPVAVARLVGKFSKRCAQISKKVAPLAEGFHHIPEVLDDAERIGLPMHESMGSVFQALFVVARASMNLPDRVQDDVSRHVCTQFPTINDIPDKDKILSGEAPRVMLDFRGFFGDVYCACVLCRVVRAGYECEFVPTK